MKPTTISKYKELRKAYLEKSTKLVKLPSGAVFKISDPKIFDMIGVERLGADADRKTEIKYIVNACLVEPKIDIDEILDNDLATLYTQCLSLPQFEETESFRKKQND